MVRIIRSPALSFLAGVGCFLTTMPKLASSYCSSSSFLPASIDATAATTRLCAASGNNNDVDVVERRTSSRRSVLSSCASALAFAATTVPANAASDDYERIAAKAAALAKRVESEENAFGNIEAKLKSDDDPAVADDRTAYDFSLPVKGEDVTFYDLIKQVKTTDGSNSDGDDGKSSSSSVKVKAVLVVNIKQDDPIARKDVPELIGLAAKYGPEGLAVVCLPTDQGYFEADTSTLLRLKMASEYGYGINPATVLTDKVNVLGTGAHPFWRWIQNRCRTPAGLGKITGNFEKFLVDGRTGLPLRRYPRKYEPNDITLDIQALLNDQRLPPASGNFKEQWRGALYDSKQDTYRFQKGLNYFDQ